ncbi:MAG: BREX-2 system adenine-specific DNA-methyltransferase PglX [Acidobacteriota bacterium]
MIDAARLEAGLEQLLGKVESDIRQRLKDQPLLEAPLRARHAAAVAAGRTAPTTYDAWLGDTITQAAVHWLLGAGFVRFLEDNGLIDTAWIAGPGEQLRHAQERRQRYYREHPRDSDREYLLHVFESVGELPGVGGLFDRRHNPVWALGPSGHGAAAILRFFKQLDPTTSELAHDFSDPELRTRFLGDLYQDLSESARERYALCQTPGFVVDFILDRTLDLALDTFGLAETRMIDPACGSGHFLLAAFDRLLAGWREREPEADAKVLAQRALDAVCGVDLNPFAVAIARFRLLIAALRACTIRRLRDAPDFRFNVATGDSLLHGRRLGTEGYIQREDLLRPDPHAHYYDAEDAEAVQRILGQRYHAVVGNPPYINVGDPALRQLYRDRFRSCHGKYQLSVPFTERFFDLAVHSDGAREPAGYVGMIVSNAFMKRSFGTKLVEKYIPRWDLTHVIDTAWVYLPAHNTPTAILFGRHQLPVSDSVRVVRGIRGEKGVPPDPANQPVWHAILDQVDRPGSESKYLSVADASRTSFHKWPWSIGGGGAAELKEALDDQAVIKLGGESVSIGPGSFPGLDDAFVMEPPATSRHGIPQILAKPFTIGDNVREWSTSSRAVALVPYNADFQLIPVEGDSAWARWLWRLKANLMAVTSFAGQTRADLGDPWWSWYRWIPERLQLPVSIVLAFVATHNQFALGRRGRVYNRHAPLITLSPSATESDHLGLLGLLNSSTACFWLKQVCFPKGGDTVGQHGARVRKVLWDVYYEFDNTRVGQFPIPARRPLALTQLIQREADARAEVLPDRLVARGAPTRAALDAARAQAEERLACMIALQEELDWQCYHFYGLTEDDLTLPPDQVPPQKLGERAFEIVMARRMTRGELETTWFERHRSKPIAEVPCHWPAAYRELVARRIALIEQDRDIGLIEQPEYKRRWNLPPWEEMARGALKNWLLDRMEAPALWKDHALRSCARLRDRLAADPEFLQVAGLYCSGPVTDLTALVTELALDEAVPFLPVLRYTESGVAKRSEWERTWELQRREDSGEKVQIPVPPKYRREDFQSATYWRLRGSLDVPKERFILYRYLEREADDTQVLGWAGWNHLEQARALVDYYQRMREEEGWPTERLKPVLAGIWDLAPWLKQWHNELDSETGVRLGDYFAAYVETQCQELGFPVAALQSWRPEATATHTGTRRRSTT